MKRLTTGLERTHCGELCFGLSAMVAGGARSFASLVGRAAWFGVGRFTPLCPRHTLCSRQLPACELREEEEGQHWVPRYRQRGREDSLKGAPRLPTSTLNPESMAGVGCPRSVKIFYSVLGIDPGQVG